MRLIDALCHYQDLAARKPISQWKPEVKDGASCSTDACAYTSNGRRECTHRDPDMVPEGVRFLKSVRTEPIDDSMTIVALKADIDRQLDHLPGKARDLFHLRYRMGMPLDAVRKVLRIRTLRDLASCHDLHMARMERALADWFPAQALAA